MTVINPNKVTTFFYLENHVITVIQDGRGTVELLQLSEMSYEQT